MKFKSFLLAHKPLITSVATSTCLIGASAGLIFGISAGMFKIEYMTLNGGEARLAASKTNNYLSEKIQSGWNMKEGRTTDGKVIPAVDEPLGIRDITTPAGIEWWKSIHGADSEPLWQNKNLEIDKPEGEGYDNPDTTYKNRYNYAALVIDGAAHSTMDRSFNQSLYQGLVDFIQNKKCDHCDPETGNDPVKQYIAKSFKPSQDSTTEFINTYVTAIENYDVLGLAGFNHSTPLSTMMTHADAGDGKVNPLASNPDAKTNNLCNSTGFILLDSNIANNQNIASVQFRADQPGFLTGLATCQYFINNLEMYHNNFQDLSVGAFGGVAIPTVIIYLGGFQRGIEFYNYFVLKDSIITGAEYYFSGNEPEYPHQAQRLETFKRLIKYSKYADDIEEINQAEITWEEKLEKFNNELAQKMYDEYSIKMIKLGKFDTHFSGTFAAGDAIGITKQYLNRGASAIIAVAGPQSLDASQEIRNQNSKCIVIGVDSSMEDGDYQRFHNGCSEANRENVNLKDPYIDRTVAPDQSRSEQSNAVIKFSAVKDLRAVSNKITRLCAEGKNWDISGDTVDEKPDPYRAVCGPGFQTCGNILNGLISVSWDGFYPLLQALQHIGLQNRYGSQIVPFEKAWAEAGATYFSTLEDEGLLDELTEKYPEYTGTNPKDKYTIDGIKDLSNSFTFKRKNSDGNQTQFYQNYDRTMQILGIIMDNYVINFPAGSGMTLIPDGQGGFIIPEQDENLSMIDWLDYNMYMMC